MDKIKERAITGAYAGKKEDCILRDKMNEIIDWINEMEQPTVEAETPEPRPVETSLTESEFKWAFGTDEYNMEMQDLPGIWNRMHGDLFEIQSHDDPIKTEPKIKKAYLESLK